MATIEHKLVVKRDTRANQPAAAAANEGMLYCVTDEGHRQERSSGSAWEQWGPKPWTLAASWTYSSDVTSVAFTNLGAYSEIMVFLRQVTTSTAVSRHIQVSSNNGSSYYSGATDYPTMSVAGAEANATAIVPHGTAATAAKTCACTIAAWNLAAIKLVQRHNLVADPVPQFVAQALAMDALQVLLSGAGNLTGGNIYVFGR